MMGARISDTTCIRIGIGWEYSFYLVNYHPERDMWIRIGRNGGKDGRCINVIGGGMGTNEKKEFRGLRSSSSSHPPVLLGVGRVTHIPAVLLWFLMHFAAPARRSCCHVSCQSWSCHQGWIGMRTKNNFYFLFFSINKVRAFVLYKINKL